MAKMWCWMFLGPFSSTPSSFSQLDFYITCCFRNTPSTFSICTTFSQKLMTDVFMFWTLLAGAIYHPPRNINSSGEKNEVQLYVSSSLNSLLYITKVTSFSQCKRSKCMERINVCEYSLYNVIQSVWVAFLSSAVGHHVVFQTNSKCGLAKLRFFARFPKDQPGKRSGHAKKHTLSLA